MEVKEYSDLYELFYTYTKACDGDVDVRAACDHLLSTFDSAMQEPDPRKAFVAQLKEDSSYSSWDPKGVIE